MTDHIQRTLARHVSFATHPKPGAALVTITGFTPAPARKPRPLNEWAFDRDLHAYLDALAQFHLDTWELRGEFPDDTLPMTYPFFGIVEHAAYVGGDVIFEKDTSYMRPFEGDIANMPPVEWGTQSAWHRRVIGGLTYMRERWGDRLFVRQRGGMSPLDMLYELRGSQLMTDMYDAPEAVNALAAQCEQALRWWIGEQLAAVDHPMGGILTGMDVWMPGRSFGHLSEDASVLCSPAMYREHGQPYMESALAGLDGAMIHLHTAGTHAFGAILENPALAVVEITDDPNAPRGIDVLERFNRPLQGKTVMITVTIDDLRTRLSLLSRHHLILRMKAATEREARESLAIVRTNL